MDPSYVTIEETSNMDESNQAGEIVVPANDERTILSYRTRGEFALLAIGSTDSQGCEFTLKHGEDVLYSLESPLGTVTDPFSFNDEYGDALLCSRELKYVVQNNTDSEKAFVARFHMEVP